jgi:hypothetical protein
MDGSAAAPLSGDSLGHMKVIERGRPPRGAMWRLPAWQKVPNGSLALPSVVVDFWLKINHRRREAVEK